MMGQRKGFTLIELLVVVAIISLLMGLLMPALQQVKLQSKTVACRSNLKQWGQIFLMYAQDHDERLPGWLQAGGLWPEVLKELWPYHADTNDLFVCPLAMRPEREYMSPGSWQLGSRSTAWSLFNADSHVRVDGSYGVNMWAQYQGHGVTAPEYWATLPAKGANRIPLVMDSVSWWAHSSSQSDPPTYEDRWTNGSLYCCINRHDGSVNGLFMDWSIRAVSLKELWTLKWHRQFNTSGPWTRAGGVQSGDWPGWMRHYRDF
jgi:prepilin-type N-terminal cleavage/methylation domain-containing protein/prepilin-type processing-associated H-X9-DG protein